MSETLTVSAVAILTGVVRQGQSRDLTDYCFRLVSLTQDGKNLLESYVQLTYRYLQKRFFMSTSEILQKQSKSAEKSRFSTVSRAISAHIHRVSK